LIALRSYWPMSAKPNNFIGDVNVRIHRCTTKRMAIHIKGRATAKRCSFCRRIQEKTN
jgi:hypothetical protein